MDRFVWPSTCRQRLEEVESYKLVISRLYGLLYDRIVTRSHAVLSNLDTQCVKSTTGIIVRIQDTFSKWRTGLQMLSSSPNMLSMSVSPSRINDPKPQAI